MSVGRVRKERLARGVSHLVLDPVIDWGDEEFIDADDVVAIRRRTTPAVVGRERRRRKIFRHHGAGGNEVPAAPVGRAVAPAPATDYTVKVQGIDVKCGSIEALREVLRHFGDSAAPASLVGLVRVPGRVNTSVHRIAVTKDVQHGECWHDGCDNPTPILASQQPASVCVKHATKTARKTWERIERQYGRSTVYPELPGQAAVQVRAKAKPPKLPKPSPEKLHKQQLLVAETATPSVGLRPTMLSDVLPGTIRWLWEHRIPRGMLTVLFAPPGTGKGTVTAALAAAVTRGSSLPLDPQAASPSAVLFVVAEDDPALTLRPRLDAANADATKVGVFGPDAGIRLPQNASDIEAAAKEMAACLVVVDPLRAFCNGDSKSAVRATLTSLADLAARTCAAVLVVHHTNRRRPSLKSPGEPIDRILGSQDIVGIPRSVLFIDEGDAGVYSLVQAKQNLAPEVAPVLFRIVGRGGVGVVEWGAEEASTSPPIESPVAQPNAILREPIEVPKEPAPGAFPQEAKDVISASLRASAKKRRSGETPATWGVGHLATTEQVEQAWSLKAAGKSVRTIAKEVGVSKSQVDRILAAPVAEKKPENPPAAQILTEFKKVTEFREVYAGNEAVEEAVEVEASYEQHIIDPAAISEVYEEAEDVLPPVLAEVAEPAPVPTTAPAATPPPARSLADDVEAPAPATALASGASVEVESALARTAVQHADKRNLAQVARAASRYKCSRCQGTGHNSRTCKGGDRDLRHVEVTRLIEEEPETSDTDEDITRVFDEEEGEPNPEALGADGDLVQHDEEEGEEDLEEERDVVTEINARLESKVDAVPTASKVVSPDYPRMPKVPLLGAQGEVDLAKEIEAAEVELWGTLLLADRDLVLRTLRERFEVEVEDDAAAEAVREAARDRDYAAAVVKALDGVSRDAIRLHRLVLAKKDAFVLANTRLVWHVAKKYTWSGMDLPDMIAEGSIGLMNAVDRFDYQNGFRFSTYAAWWIRHRITRAINDTGRTVRVPVHIHDAAVTLRGVEKSLAASLGRQPTVPELAEASGFSEKKIRHLREVTQWETSLDKIVYEDGNATLLDFLEAPGTPDEFPDRIVREKIGAVMDKHLSAIERDVIERRFGLHEGEGEMSLPDVGEKHGLSRERIRQIEAIALERMRRGIAQDHVLRNDLADEIDAEGKMPRDTRSIVKQRFGTTDGVRKHTDEIRKQYTCSACQKPGHSKQTCNRNRPES